MSQLHLWDSLSFSWQMFPWSRDFHVVLFPVLVRASFPLNTPNSREWLRPMSLWFIHCQCRLSWPSQSRVLIGSLWSADRHLCERTFIRNICSIQTHCWSSESTLHLFNSTPASPWESSRHRLSALLWIMKLHVPAWIKLIKGFCLYNIFQDIPYLCISLYHF